MLVTFSTIFCLPFPLGNRVSKMSEKLDFSIMFYTKCINVKIDSIGPSIILRSIYLYDRLEIACDLIYNLQILS